MKSFIGVVWEILCWVVFFKILFEIFIDLLLVLVLVDGSSKENKDSVS